MGTRQAPSELSARIESLREIPAGWDGSDAPAPTVGLTTARKFAEGLGRLSTLPSVGPANDGGVVFEWDLPRRVSVYCYAREQSVEITAFNDEKDLVELVAPPLEAAELVRALLTVFEALPLGATS